MWKTFVFAAFCICWTINILEADNTINDFNLNTNEVEDFAIGAAGTCNVSLEAKNGEIKPKYQKTLLKSGFYCMWNITSTNFSGPVTLFFSYIFLDENDEVNIYQNTTKNFTDPIIQKPIKAQNGSITVITGLDDIIVTLKGVHPNYTRHFEVYYTHENSYPVPPDVNIIHSPIYADTAEDFQCVYYFNAIQHMRAKQVFTFKEFNMSNSVINIQGGTISKITTDLPEDFFLSDPHIMTVTVDIKKNSSDYFILHTNLVDTECSGIIEVSDYPITLNSPKEVLNNGTIVTECRWLLKHTDHNKILGLKLNTLDFLSVFDLVAVNDGLSEISSPLMQVSFSNRNSSQNQIIRSDKRSPYLWVSFKPLNYASHFTATVTSHSNGGYMKNNGTIEISSADKDPTIFLLEVNKDEIIKLMIVDSSFLPPATLSIYDGFDYSNLLTTLHGQVKFPVLSKSSKMMIIGKNFVGKANHFTAHFEGIISGCDHMSTISADNYILSENCNSTCNWILAPQESSNTELVFNFQYISLKENDKMEIYKLDENLTQLGIIFSNVTHMPHLAVPTNVGALIKITQGVCQIKKDKIVLIGHSNIIPECNQSITLKSSEKSQISSPLYPDTYPLFTQCQWNISTSKGNFYHMTFQTMKLAEGHCIRIYQNSSKIKYEYDGKTLPNDLLLYGDVLVQFDSYECNKKYSNKNLNTGAGFLLNITVADCGGVLKGKKSGEFNTSISGNKSLCIWEIDVSESDSVNIISYSVSKKDSLENYELTIYNGPSSRDSVIVNSSNSNIWSRSSTLIFMYKRLNVSQPSSVFVFKYETISCNKSMLCENNICMHPDWKCNGINECGDFSDERYCKSIPIPSHEDQGYSAAAFWLCGSALLLIGVIVGLTTPVCYQKYKDSRYTRFRELSGIDG